jgi:hypothetical protein
VRVSEGFRGSGRGEGERARGEGRRGCEGEPGVRVSEGFRGEGERGVRV